jgi:RES domain-containing protein
MGSKLSGINRHRTIILGQQPIYRVVRAGWKDPMDASFSQSVSSSRWNTRQFPALYCACSLAVARAIVWDLLRITALEIADLQPEFHPCLIEVAWSGTVVDIASEKGIEAAGFPSSYPEGIHKEQTRQAAIGWYNQGAEGVACRSASLWRLGLLEWVGSYLNWSEVAIYVELARQLPRQIERREDLEWLLDNPQPSGRMSAAEP